MDIDNDGDYDCYEEYYDSLKTGSHRNAHVLFLRNNGKKEIPYLGVDTTSGFV